MTAGKKYDLSGQLALVTGAGRGIGEACARSLASVGAEVVLTARSSNQLENVQNEITSSGGKASVHVADLLKIESVQELKKLGPFNILVNNAGNNIPEHFCDVTEENFDLINLTRGLSCQPFRGGVQPRGGHRSRLQPTFLAEPNRPKIERKKCDNVKRYKRKGMHGAQARAPFPKCG